MNEHMPLPRRERRGLLSRLWPLAVLATGTALFFVLGLHRYVSFEVLRQSRGALLDWVEAYPVAAPLIYMAAYIAMTAFSLPGALLLTLTGGFLFGTVLGGTYTVIGATLGAVALFLAARTALGDMLRAKAGGALAKLEAGFRKDAFNYLLVLRLIPIFPFFVVNLAAAFLGTTLPVFVAATAVGIVPGTFIYASVGNGLGAVFDAGGKPEIGIVFTWPVLGPLIALALLALLPVAYRHFRRTP